MEQDNSNTLRRSSHKNCPTRVSLFISSGKKRRAKSTDIEGYSNINQPVPSHQTRKKCEGLILRSHHIRREGHQHQPTPRFRHIRRGKKEEWKLNVQVANTHERRFLQNLTNSLSITLGEGKKNEGLITRTLTHDEKVSFNSTNSVSITLGEGWRRMKA